jgi:hypothetical protein
MNNLGDLFLLRRKSTENSFSSLKKTGFCSKQWVNDIERERFHFAGLSQ